MSLADRSRAFLKAEASGNVFGLVLAACQLKRVTVGRRKWARRWHRGTIETWSGERIIFTAPKPAK